MSKYLFYPGCSIQRSARPYLDSTIAIQDDIGLELEDVQDWNCCGATEYQSVHKVASHALVGRNLALATKQMNGTNTLATACSACYLNLLKTDQYMAEDNKLEANVNEALAAGDLHYDPGTLEVRHLLDIVYNDIGLEAVKQKVSRPLKGLRVAPYYGCMVVRPDPYKRFDDPEYPKSLDKLVKVLGAEVIDFPMKTHCCGGHMTQISEPTAFELLRRLLYAADQYGADMLVTLCPMCQLNLDAYQSDVNRTFGTDYRVPILYFTQLMGLAFGHEAEALGIGKDFVDPRAAMAKIGVEVPEEEAVPVRRRRRRDDPTLPMPSMAEYGEEEG